MTLLLFALKISHPKTIILLRGNHESRQMTQYFNFRHECLAKYDEEVYDIIMEAFDHLPLACIVNGKFICMHGGISPDIKTIEDINRINRILEIPV